MRQGLPLSMFLAVSIGAGMPQISAADQHQHTSTQTTRAQRYHRRGQMAYTEGRYESAAAHFLAAYERDPLPRYLLKAAQSYRKARAWERAVRWYRAFLQADPQSRLRKRVEALIASKGRRIGPPAEQSRSAAVGGVDGETRPFYRTWWFWTGVAAVVGTGVGIGVYAGTREPDHVKEGGLGSVRW